MLYIMPRDNAGRNRPDRLVSIRIAHPRLGVRAASPLVMLVERFCGSAIAATLVWIVLVDFARTAGQHLHQAQTMLDAGGFDRWVETTLAITPDEAHALMQFANDPAVARVDVSPVRAMALSEALGLVSRACRPFSG